MTGRTNKRVSSSDSHISAVGKKNRALGQEEGLNASVGHKAVAPLVLDSPINIIPSYHANTASSSGQWESVSDFRNETFGGLSNNIYVSQEVGRIVEPILNALAETKNPDVAREGKQLALSIIESLSELKVSNFEIMNFPSFIAVNLEDGSFLIEWLFLNYRVGFVIESDPKNSLWYVVSKNESSDSNLSGNLADSDKRELLARLISYVAVNS